MHSGVVIFATEYSIRVDELARAAEERGFESLWLPEHTHIPTSRRSPWPGGGELPRRGHGPPDFARPSQAPDVVKRITEMSSPFGTRFEVGEEEVTVAL